MRLRWGRASEVRDLVLEHAGLVVDTVAAMRKGIEACLDGAPWEELEELAIEAHRLEGNADDLRRKTELELVRGALLAGSRQTLLRLVERADRLANAAEESMSFLVLQRIKIPELLHPLLREIVSITHAQAEDVRAAIQGLLDGDEETVKHIEAVDHKEGLVDELERRSITRLFSTDLDLAQKILVREFVERLVEVSDRGEDVVDIVLIALATRRP